MNEFLCDALGVNEADYRVVLGQRIKAARRRKFRTVDKARVAASVARGTWDKAEKGLPIKDFSLASIEAALEWEPGYAASILAGKDPDRRGLAAVLSDDETPRLRPRVGGFDAYMEDIEDRLDELEARMARIEELSAASGTVPLAAAADDQEQPAAGEAESYHET